MKKNKFIVFVNWILLFSLPAILMTSNITIDQVKSDHETKNLATSLFTKVEEKTQEVLEIDEEPSEDQEEEIEEKEALEEKEKKQQPPKKEEQPEEVVEPVVSTPPPQEEERRKEESANDVLATYTGNMSFYYANCQGCSGLTKVGGYDVRDGKLYYPDKQYGNVRIVAAGSEISNWSIIRIKNSSMGDNILAIVLDRGSDIGLGRKFLIDMLTNTNEARGGVHRNITVEVLRNGK